MPTITGRHYDTNEPIQLTHENGRITDVQPWADEPAGPIRWIAPGLVDLQINGIGGHEFLDEGLTDDDLNAMCKAIVATGATRCLPTVTTESFDRLANSLSRLSRFVESSEPYRSSLPGFHVEGPYISTEDGPRGAHPKKHCRPPSLEEFRRLQDAAQGRIKVLTMSPEYEGCGPFIEQVVAMGVKVAIGHTAANSEQIADAVSAGASFSTHLGNGAHATIRRHPNYIWDQLADDRLLATIIADGHHLPASVVRCFHRCKTNSRLILVSDMTGMAGMPVGVHSSSSLGKVEVLEDGRLVVAGQRQYLAGASRPLWDGVKNVIRFAGVKLGEAIQMASRKAATLIDEPPHDLAVGAPADLVLIEEAVPDSPDTHRLKTVIRQGETLPISNLIKDPKP